MMKRVISAIGLAVFAVVYGLSPIDLVPEAVFGPVGFADDLAVLVAAVAIIRKLFKAEQADEAAPPNLLDPA